MTPDQRAHWETHIRSLRDFWDGPHPDNPTDEDALEELAEITVADHVVALEAQVAEARRLIQQHLRAWDDLTKHYICIGCWGSLDAEPEHDPDCPLVAFLAATAEPDAP